MKRRTAQHVGNWPNMRADTLKAISDQLILARKKHPDKTANLKMLEICTASLRLELRGNHEGNMSAVQVYARAAQIAALAIRCLEEGSDGYRYGGNVKAPDNSGIFERTP